MYVGRPVDVIGQRDEKGVNPSVSHSADSPEAVCQNERARGDTSQLPDAGKFENMRVSARENCLALSLYDENVSAGYHRQPPAGGKIAVVRAESGI
jgi:hypothetical protein